MRNERLCGIIEAILFVCGDALEMDELANALGHTSEAIQAAVEDLETLLAAGYRGVQVKRFGSKVQLVSKAEYATYVERVLQPVQKQSLSQAARNPGDCGLPPAVTRQEVEAVRGLNVITRSGPDSKGFDHGRRAQETLGRPICTRPQISFVTLRSRQPQGTAGFAREPGADTGHTQLKMDIPDLDEG